MEKGLDAMRTQELTEVNPIRYLHTNYYSAYFTVSTQKFTQNYTRKLYNQKNIDINYSK